MKKLYLLGIASLTVGLGSMSYAKVTHTIKNTSDHAIGGWVAYRGEIKGFSCRTDQSHIKPGTSFTSEAGGCLLKFVQIQDGAKVIKQKVANASANIAGDAIRVAAAVGSDDYYRYQLYSGNVKSSTISELVVYAATDTVWEYDGVSLKPVKGVKAYGQHDFSRSN